MIISLVVYFDMGAELIFKSMSEDRYF